MSLSLAERLQYTNPVFARELRTRWRRPLTYIGMVCYAILWSILLPNGQSSPEQFLSVWGLHTMLWAIVAPLMTAASITVEREQSMLTELLLSRLTVRDVVYGKFFASVSFVGLLLIGAALILAPSMLNGVPPILFLNALLLQIAVAIAGLGVGVMCSAWSRTTTGALGGAFCVGIVGAVVLAQGVSGGSPLGSVGSVPLYSAGLILIAYLCLQNAQIEVASSVRWEHWSDPQPSLSTSTASTIVPTETARSSQAIRQNEIEDESERVYERNGESFERVETPRKSSDFGWLTPWIRSNPLILREWRVRSRNVSAGNSHDDFNSVVQIANSPIMLVVWFGVGLTLSMVFGPSAGSAQVLCTFTMLWLLGVTAYCAFSASTAFIRERDQGMLLTIVLTRLSPREIVWGKQSVPLTLLFYYFAPGFLLFLGWGIAHPAIIVGCIALILATSWCAAACGVVFSWLCRHTTLAALGAMGTASVIFAMAPAVLPMPGGGSFVGSIALMIGDDLNIYDKGTGALSFLLTALTHSAYLLVIGTLLLFVVARGLRPAMLDGESRSWLHLDLSRSMTRGFTQASTK